MRVPKYLLATKHAEMAELDMLPSGQIVELNQTLIEPLLIRMLAGENALHFVVAHNATLRGVHEEHAAGLQATLLHNARWIDVDHAALARHHHEIVVGDPVTPGAKPVTVEHRTNHGAIGERHVGGTIPWFHQRRMEPVERAPRRIHVGVVFPCFGDHHQHCVRQ